MKLFEIKTYQDGGPTDRGILDGYIKAESKEQGLEILGINHGFTQLHEITEEEFLKRKAEAWRRYKMYKILV